MHFDDFSTEDICIREASIDDMYMCSLLVPEFSEPYEKPVYIERLSNKKHLCLLAESGGVMLGFKVGYALDNELFYSWMGGVTPEARGKGIAVRLLLAQTAWCQHAGFQRIQVKTRNKFVGMLRLLLKYNYQLIDFQKYEPLEESRVLLEADVTVG